MESVAILNDVMAAAKSGVNKRLESLELGLGYWLSNSGKFRKFWEEALRSDPDAVFWLFYPGGSGNALCGNDTLENLERLAKVMRLVSRREKILTLVCVGSYINNNGEKMMPWIHASIVSPNECVEAEPGELLEALDMAADVRPSPLLWEDGEKSERMEVWEEEDTKMRRRCDDLMRRIAERVVKECEATEENGHG